MEFLQSDIQVTPNLIPTYFSGFCFNYDQKNDISILGIYRKTDVQGKIFLTTSFMMLGRERKQSVVLIL